MVTSGTTMIDSRPELYQRPWIVWSDFDSILDSDKVAELEYLVLNLRERSFVDHV